MNQNDHLFDIAFDGSEQDIRNLKATVSGTDSKELDAMLQLKADLRSLRDIPECQLSSERIKEGILRAKVSETSKPARRWLNWLPLASAVAMGVFLNSLPKDSQTADSKISDNSVAINTNVPSKNDSSSDNSEVAMNQVNPLSSNAIKATVKSSSQPRRKVNKQVQRSQTRTSNDLAIKTEAMTATFDSVAKYKAVAMETSNSLTDSEAMRDTKQDSGTVTEPVVVVTDISNPETGTAEAREISKQDNVLFGG